MTGTLGPRRPDQGYDPPPAATTPGQRANLRASTVTIISPAGNLAGLFEYNGKPGLGNPPVVAITQGSSDPYGNPVTPGLDVKTGSITGTTISASEYDGTNFTVQPAGLFFYSG